MSEIDDLEEMIPESPFLRPRPVSRWGRKFRDNERCVHVAGGQKCKAPRMVHSKFCRLHQPSETE